MIAALQEGESGVLERLYDCYRIDFLRWAGKRFRTTPGDIEDAWQEAVVTFYEQVTSHKIATLHCSIRTYLYAVGYKHLLKNHRKLKRIFWKDEIDKALTDNPIIAAFESNDPWEEERDILRAAMNELSLRCQELLVRRHYHEQSIAGIMADFQYASVNTVSVSLSNCLAGLKKIIETKTKK